MHGISFADSKPEKTYMQSNSMVFDTQGIFGLLRTCSSKNLRPLMATIRIVVSKLVQHRYSNNQ